MRKGSGLKTAFLATALSVVGVLAGCAHPQLVSMGETQQEVIAYLGEPHAKTQMPDGTTRLTYSGQPYGQDAGGSSSVRTVPSFRANRACRRSTSICLRRVSPPKPMCGLFGGSARRSTNFRLLTNTRGCTVTRLRVDSTWPCGRSLMSTASCVRWK